MTMKEVRCSLDTEPAGCNERNCLFGHEKPRFIDGEFFPPNLGELASSACSIEEFVEELIHNVWQELLEAQTLATYPCTKQEALVASLTPAESSSPSSTPLVPDTTASTQKAPVGNENQKWMIPSTELSTTVPAAAAAAAVTSAMTLASNVSLKISLKEEKLSKKRKRVNDNHKLLGPPSKRARVDSGAESYCCSSSFQKQEKLSKKRKLLENDAEEPPSKRARVDSGAGSCCCSSSFQKQEKLLRKRKLLENNAEEPPSKRARPDNLEEVLELAAQFEALSIS